MNNENIANVGPFLGTLRRRARPVDALAVVVVPLVLGLVYRLPAETRRSLAFEYTDPSLLTAFTANFVHLGPNHLLVNVFTYVAAASVALLLAAMNGTRRRFYAAFVLFLVAVPVALSYLNLAFVRPAIGFGFSGVVMAFVGYLPVAVAEYLEEQFDIGPRTDLAPVLFFGSLALIAVLSLRSVATDRAEAALASVGLALAAALVALVYAAAVYDRTGGVRAKVRAGLDAPGYAELAAVGIVLVVAVQFAAFPSNPSNGAGTLNLYTHLLGYAIGFVLVYSAVEAADRFRPAVSASLSSAAPTSGGPSPQQPSPAGAPPKRSPVRELSLESETSGPLADAGSARRATARRRAGPTASRRGGRRVTPDAGSRTQRPARRPYRRRGRPALGGHRGGTPPSLAR